MAALATDEVLRDEVKAIHDKDFSGQSGEELYQSLNGLDSAALCLSGGGIRSAAFGLGVIEALATHPKAPNTRHVAQAEDSLLAKFCYLSTVSGGGYIGSWLSAWVTRAGFSTVWSNLVRRPAGPDIEPPATAWLRSYSNYLTPKLGLVSADAWAALALILRNLVLNWLVVLPALCAALVAVKFYAFIVAWFSQFYPLACGPWMNAAAIAAVLALFIALWFTHIQRPAHCASTARQFHFLLGSLLPAVLSGIFFSFALASPCAHDALYALKWFAGTDASLVTMGLRYGIAIYLVAWILALPWWQMWRRLGETLSQDQRGQKTKSALPDRRAWGDVRRDFVAVLGAGATYGVLMALGLYLYFQVWDHGIWRFERSEILLLLLAVPWAMGSQLIAEMILVGLSSYEKNSDSDREWLGRGAGWYLATALTWAVIMFLVFLASTVAADLYRQVWAWLTGGGAGAIAAWLGKSSATPAKGATKTRTGLSANVLAALAATVFAALLVVMASAVLDNILLGDTLIYSAQFRPEVTEADYPPWPGNWWLPGGLAAALVIGIVASHYVNINRFSLHALYRNRLIRAFLGASHADTRNPNPFTNFDNSDNLRVSELWPPKDLWAESRGKGWQPFHVINIALNIVSTKRLAWQERKAETFTVSPLHSGSACGGLMRLLDGSLRARGSFRPSNEYGDEDGVSLGTAMAISGAAASPNMGYHSSPPLAFLMTLFNVRLGWWLGNPQKEKKIYGSEGPRCAIVPLIAEMFGLTNDDSNYVYLSDGGHFENLGLYEMVRRRCRFIIVSDAGCDPEFAFEDLGNAVRKIALDLGVTITFHGISILKSRAEEDRLSRCCKGTHKDKTEKRPIGDDEEPLCALGTIDYGIGQTGIVLYVKAAYRHAIVKNVGVRSYAIANADFPHQSTSDQWFTESQFESYRALGFELMDDVLAHGIKLLANPANPTLAGIFTALHDKAADDGRP